jgi:hypothetical protein
MAIHTRLENAALLLFTLLTLAAMPVRASLYSLAASGTISVNNSGDSTIPSGTPWSFELTYDTAAPDLDSELTGLPPDPTFGRFTNTAEPPALMFFHYRAGDYEVTVDDPTDFGTVSNIHITATSTNPNVNAIDINIDAPDLFPTLAGGAVSFHADFNRFGSPIFSSDALPTNTDIDAESFELSTVSLIKLQPPPSGTVSGSATSITLTAVPSMPGDFNLNGVLDSADIDQLSSAIRNVSVNVKYDLNHDGAINADDRGTWISELRTYFGDSDLNGEFDSSDLLLVFAAGKYETTQNANWASGDWDGDGNFTSTDLITALADGGYEQGPRTGIRSVPEPSGIVPIGLAILAAIGRYRRNEM